LVALLAAPAAALGEGAAADRQEAAQLSEPSSLSEGTQSEDAQPEEGEAEAFVATSEWVTVAELGTGFDTNANGWTRQNVFLGFFLPPRFIGRKSSFGELGVKTEHTATLIPDGGFVTTMELSHRGHPDADFADQTYASLGTEAVLVRRGLRFSAGLSGYTSWMGSGDRERAGHFDLNVARDTDTSETALTLRTSRLGNEQREFEDADIDRHMLAWTFKRIALGPRDATAGVTLVAGRDVARREGSPFSNDRWGVELTGSWLLKDKVRTYLELSVLHSDYDDPFFRLPRTDDLYNAAAALEFEDWPGANWLVTPQLRYQISDSTVSLYAYDRVEAMLYLRRRL
jgi:hypothetical protein